MRAAKARRLAGVDAIELARHHEPHVTSAARGALEAASWMTKGTPSAETCTSNSTSSSRAARPPRAPAACFPESVPRRPGVRRWLAACARIHTLVPSIPRRLPSRQAAGGPGVRMDRRARRERLARRLRGLPRQLPRGPACRPRPARALDGLLDAAAWSRAERLATPEAWQRYLGEFPDRRNAAKARQRLIDSSRRPRYPRTAVTSSNSVRIRPKPRPGRTSRAQPRNTSRRLSGIGLRVIAPRRPADSIWRFAHR